MVAPLYITKSRKNLEILDKLKKELSLSIDDIRLILKEFLIQIYNNIEYYKELYKVESSKRVISVRDLIIEKIKNFR